VTVDGGGAGYSVGMTNFELAVALVHLGAVQAMALGSGPSASVAFDGSLLSKPTPAEGEISDAVVVLYTGVYAPPPSETVVSPNGDGVAETTTLSYRLARTATVSAVVTGEGPRQVLDTGVQQPGLHTFTFSGKGGDGSPLPEGAYKLAVTATDDRGIRSVAERTFAVNETLSSLTVAPTALRLRKGNRNALAIGFTLSRSATVTATIETKTGIVIRKLDERTLPAGPQRLLWDGRTSGGGLAFNGAYVVRIAADNTVGEVELAQPFTARRS
jgi:flagellar hook assembly protein FlgD